MKILILTDGIYPFVIGGMQKHSFYLAKFLALQNHKVTLVHCVAHNKELPTTDEVLQQMEIITPVALTTIACKFPQPGILPGHYLKESYIYSKNIYLRLKDQLNDFDFIYAKGFSAWHLLHEKSKGKKFPPIGVKFHGYEMFQPAGSLKSKLEAWMLRNPVKWNNQQADFVCSYGGRITGLLETLGVAHEKIIEIPTGIASAWCLNELPKSERKEIHFVFVGRFERRKGVEELTEVLRSSEGEHDFHFHFIGPIPASRKIKSEKITYHGQLTIKKDIQKILDSCDVLVTPSHSEGMPNVILEGMARGLAILATDVGAVPVVVKDENGWLLPPMNTEMLRQTIENICGLDKEVVDAKRKASLQIIKDFFWEKIAAQTAEKIVSAIAKVKIK